MSIKTKTGMALMIAIAMSGCGSDMTESQRIDGMMPVGVSDVVSVGTDIAISRSASSITANGAKMGVFRIGDTNYTAQENVEFTYSSSTGTWGYTSIPILVNVQATDLCAYYPFNSASFSGTTASLSAQKYDSAKDLSFATSSGSSVTNATPNANFTMKHAYARIRMSIKRHTTNNIGNCAVSTVNIKNKTNFFLNKTLDIKTGSYGGSATTDGWTYTLDTGNIGAGSTNSAYDVLVPPQPVNSGLTITLNVDGVERPVTVPAVSFSSNLNAGSQYSISLVITDTEVIPSGSVNVADWVTDNTSIGGKVEVEPLPPPPITVPASDINLGGADCTAQDKTDLSQLTWADGNLEGSGNNNPYDWAVPTGYGYYYTWMSTYTGNTSTNGIDPCTELDSKYGSGWRTPSKNELTKLARCTDKKLVNNNGVNGMWFMNNPKGLFLPAAGYRSSGEGSGTTATSYAGFYGYYWSSDAYLSSYAYYLSFISDNANADNLSGRALGCSVRCVQGAVQ